MIDGWTEFQFSSVESKRLMHKTLIDYASAINFGTGRKLWSFSGIVSTSKMLKTKVYVVE